MFVEAAGEVATDQVFVIDSETDDLPGKVKVVQVVRVDVALWVWLECSAIW